MAVLICICQKCGTDLNESDSESIEAYLLQNEIINIVLYASVESLSFKLKQPAKIAVFVLTLWTITLSVDKRQDMCLPTFLVE